MKMRNLSLVGLVVVIFMLVLMVIKLDQVNMIKPTHNPKAEVYSRLRDLKMDLQNHTHNPSSLPDLKMNLRNRTSSANIDVHNVFSEDCRCRSMFTVGGCHMKQVINLQKDPVQASALSGLSAARLEGTQMFTFMEILARYLPQLFTTHIKTNSNNVFGMFMDKNPSRVSKSLPFVPCSIHIYTSNDVNICTERFFKKWSVPFRITFVGDSRSRNTMQEMIRMLMKELNLYIVDDDLNRSISYFIDTKEDFNIPIKGDNIEMNYIWAPVLEKRSDKPANGYNGIIYGARDIFEVWSEGKSWTNTKTNQTFTVPHLVVVNTGMWHTMNDDAVSDFISTMHIMTPLLEKLSMRTRVLWPLQGPIKENLALATRADVTPALNMMNSIAWLKLKRSKVWLWDTRTILMLRQKQECFSFYKSGLMNNLPPGWGCSDFQHAGRDVERGAVNMAWNLICNSLMNREAVYCCS